MSDHSKIEWTDAIIEDTVRCSFCGASWTLGTSGDGIVVTRQHGPTVYNYPGQLRFCMDCAAFITRTYEMEADEVDDCPHGEIAGEWCEICQDEFRRAKEGGG